LRHLLAKPSEQTFLRLAVSQMDSRHSCLTSLWVSFLTRDIGAQILP
jgi:hypothetical protein